MRDCSAGVGGMLAVVDSCCGFWGEGLCDSVRAVLAGFTVQGLVVEWRYVRSDQFKSSVDRYAVRCRKCDIRQ